MIRALVAMDVRVTRDALAALLRVDGTLEVVGACACDTSAVDSVRDCATDVVLLDARAACARSVLRQLSRLDPQPLVIAIGLPDDQECVLDWLEAGAFSYVPLDGDLRDLTRTVIDALRGEVHCPPSTTARLIRRMGALAAQGRSIANGADDLTLRQREVLGLLAKGLPNKAIATHLGIATSTAKNHVHRILDRLNLHRRVDAAAVLRERARRESST